MKNLNLDRNPNPALSSADDTKEIKSRITIKIKKNFSFPEFLRSKFFKYES